MYQLVSKKIIKIGENMNKKIRSILFLIVVLALGFTFTGCGNEDIEKKESDTSTEMSENSEANNDEVDDSSNSEGLYADFEEFESIDWAEIADYKVDTIVEESMESGVYTLIYLSDKKPGAILDYYDSLLKGTDNYLVQAIPNVGGMVKGTINSHGILVAVEADENSDEVKVSFFSYDSSYIAE